MPTLTSRAWIDTSALLALATPRDQYHDRALALAKAFLAGGGRWVSSGLVLAEFHAHVLHGRGAAIARSAVANLLLDPAYAWIDVTVSAVTAAVSAWLERFHDQRFTLTDAVSFELMRRERLTEAFAFDRHFVTAGFKLLE